jgi:predicted nucleotidyltransferase
MTTKTNILYKIKSAVENSDPNATVILYGSYARGDQNKNSDIDLLILVDHDKLTRNKAKNIKYPLYDIEFETGTIISPIILTRKDWENKHRITPFYENVTNEGQVL